MTLRRHHLALALLLAAGSVALAQQPSNSQPARTPDNKGHDNRQHVDEHGRGGPSEPAYHVMPPGMPNIWWHIPGLAQSIGLTADQQKRMDDILSQNRKQLFQQHVDFRRQRDLLQTMLDAGSPDTAKISPQIERVAQARAAEEAAFAKVLLNIRLVLTPDQWTKLQAENSHWQAAHPQSKPSDNNSDHHDRNFQGRPGGSPAQSAQPPA